MAATNGIQALPSVQSNYGTEAVKQVNKAEAAKSQPSAVANADHAGSTAVTHSRPDHTSLSSASSLIAAALKGSDVRGEKVAALQQQIANGTYHVPASAVAGKIVDSLLQ